MMTPLRPTIEKRIGDQFSLLREKQVEPWSTFGSGVPFEVYSYTGKKVSYEGIKFEGSPQMVFWSRYIEPFIESIVTSEIKSAVALLSGTKVNPESLLIEAQELFLKETRAIFERMSEIDHRQRSYGYPEHTAKRSIEPEYHQVEKFIKLHIAAEIELSQRSKFENWYKNNQFSVWVIGSVITVIGICAAFA